LYQTDWASDSTIRYVDSLEAEEDWFVRMSYGDPRQWITFNMPDDLSFATRISVVD
jgi:hypothetical protein